ncbi:hypothetical protein CTA2_447 [Colletotrichum tanaceti]|uniref:Uncharacterized protein n=1 Tax=Colletotrichum tanaceti TaxID=1306861 RepID=A0A4U6XHC6_9PEZI|nr:hypothetical protein CTA2_447 [Colletotrichum tanaceti]TKW55328.1 hypothetical protein CTA1_12790 [Colletotrichum tanaceti]
MYGPLLVVFFALRASAVPVADSLSAGPSVAQLASAVSSSLAVQATLGVTVSSSSSSPSSDAAAPSTAAGPLPTTNLSYENLKQCTVPSTGDVGFDTDDLHDFIDPNTGLVDELNPGLWNALSMDAWLRALITNCPALSLPGNYADKTAYQFPVALGKVLIVSSETVLCADIQDCTWSPYGDNFPGPDRPPTVPDHSDASITNLRKWYALSAIHEVHFYYAQMKFNFEQAKPWGQGVLGVLVNNLDPKAVTEGKGVGIGVWLDIASAVLAFTPLSSIVSNLANSLKDDAKVAEQAANLLAGIKKWKPLTASNLKGAAKAGFGLYKASQPDPAQPEDQFSKWSTFSADFATQMSYMSTSMSSVWQKAMYGDPTAEGGYLDMVTGGAFSAQQTGSPEVSNDLRLKYQQYILEKAAMGVFANKQLFLYTSHWDDKPGCDSAMAANVIPGQACYPDPAPGATGWIYYAPFQPEFDVFCNAYESTQDHTWYQGLLYTAISTGQYQLNWKDIYQGSAACFDANNADWYAAATGATVGLSGAAVQPNIYSPETPSYTNDAGTSDPSSAACHWNIPVLNSNSPAAANGCHSLQQTCWESYQIPGSRAGDAPMCNGIDNAPQGGNRYGQYQFLAYGSQLFAGTTPVQCNAPDYNSGPFFFGPV